MILKTFFKFGYHTFLCFVILFVLTLPFPYDFLFDIGSFLSAITKPAVGWVGAQFMKKPYVVYIASDTAGMYILAFLCLGLGFILSSIYQFFGSQKEIAPEVKYYFNTFISYFLALHLFKYGFDKVFKHQFYFPEPNTLYTPLGYLSKSMLYWSSIGTSYSYSMFLGCLEVLVALLLCFRKTRVLGAMVALVVMVQVLAVNFCFDISVKFFAMFLTILALSVSLPGFKVLYSSLVQEKAVSLVSWKPNFTNHKLQLCYVLGKSFVISILVFESLYVYFKTWSFNGDRDLKRSLYGAYRVIDGAQSQGLKRIFIHSRGYLIVQNQDEVLKDYKLLEDDGLKLILDRKEEPHSILYYTHQKVDSCLDIQGYLSGKPIQIRTKMLNIDHLPLHDDSFRWTVEGYVQE